MSDFWNRKKVKTKKPHHCEYCGRSIPIGTVAQRTTGKFEGDWMNWYACLFCVENVEPQYAEPGEPITGDEFWDWACKQFSRDCINCHRQLYGRDAEFATDGQSISCECGTCGVISTINVPLEGSLKNENMQNNRDA